MARLELVAGLNDEVVLPEVEQGIGHGESGVIGQRIFRVQGHEPLQQADGLAQHGNALGLAVGLPYGFAAAKDGDAVLARGQGVACGALR